MKITILGLPQVGKTTIFNAVTKGDIKVTGYSDKVNIGVAKAPDYRLDNLTDLYNPKRTVQAEITYSDLPFLSDGLGKSEKIEGEHLNLLQQSDVLILVARAFSDLSIVEIPLFFFHFLLFAFLPFLYFLKFVIFLTPNYH